MDYSSITTVPYHLYDFLFYLLSIVLRMFFNISGVVSQYYYSVRVFAGQDPACVWAGWVTPDYHYYSNNFNLSKNRTVTVTLGDERGRVHER